MNIIKLDKFYQSILKNLKHNINEIGFKPKPVVKKEPETETEPVNTIEEPIKKNVISSFNIFNEQFWQTEYLVQQAEIVNNFYKSLELLKQKSTVKEQEEAELSHKDKTEKMKEIHSLIRDEITPVIELLSTQQEFNDDELKKIYDTVDSVLAKLDQVKIFFPSIAYQKSVVDSYLESVRKLGFTISNFKKGKELNQKTIIKMQKQLKDFSKQLEKLFLVPSVIKENDEEDTTKERLQKDANKLFNSLNKLTKDLLSLKSAAQDGKVTTDRLQSVFKSYVVRIQKEISKLYSGLDKIVDKEVGDFGDRIRKHAKKPMLIPEQRLTLLLKPVIEKLMRDKNG